MGMYGTRKGPLESVLAVLAAIVRRLVPAHSNPKTASSRDPRRNVWYGRYRDADN